MAVTGSSPDSRPQHMSLSSPVVRSFARFIRPLLRVSSIRRLSHENIPKPASRMTFLSVRPDIRSDVQSIRREKTTVGPVVTHRTYQSLLHATRPSVVCVESYAEYAGKEWVISSGSGFVIDGNEGWVVTSSLNVGCLPFCRLVTSDGRRIQASVQWLDQTVNLAVLQMEEKGMKKLPALTLGSSSDGEVVAVTGVRDEDHLQSYAGQKEEPFYPSLTMAGQTHWTDRMDRVFETEVYGMIGGPVVNTKCEVVAVAHIHDIDQPLGVPIEYIMYYMMRRRTSNPLPSVIKCRRLYGLLTFGYTSYFRTEFNVSSRFSDKRMEGVVVVYCAVGSPAHDSGLRVDDVILTINNETADNSLLTESLENLINVQMTVCRKDRLFIVQMPAGRWPTARSCFGISEVPIPRD